MKMVIRFVLVCISLIVLFSVRPLFSSTSLASNKHLTAWQGAANNKFIYYTNRLISVRHPEIYLRADVQTLADIRKYRPDVTFDWEWLKTVKNISEAERYPKDAPFYPFLDRRILPPTATLLTMNGSGVARQDRMTPLEKAVIGYYLMKASQQAADPAIIYCNDSSAFVTSGETAVEMSSMRKISLSDVTCPIVFIFNEKDAYYPLMGRYPSNAGVGNVLKVVSLKATKIASVAGEEMTIIDKLKNATRLSPIEEPAAVLLAQKRGPIITQGDKYVTDKSLFQRWKTAAKYNDDRLETNVWRVHLGLSHLLMQGYNITGNRLSPVVAYLADTSDCSGAIPKCFMKKFDKFFSWNILWDWGFTSLSIDEANATGGGGVCAEQSTYAAAALDLMGVDYYMLHFTGFNSNNRKKDHRIIYVPSWNKTISNDKLLDGFKEPDEYKGLVYIYHGGNWIFFADDVLFGNVSKTDADNLLGGLLDVIKTAKAEDLIACKPFAVEPDMDSCLAVRESIKGNSYKKIGIVPASIQALSMLVDLPLKLLN